MTATPPLGPDPALPSRDLLLDQEATARRLELLLGMDGPIQIDRWTRSYAKYRIGESLRLVHRFETSGVVHTVASRTFRPGESDGVYRTATSVARDCGRIRGVVHDPERETVFWTFPNDRKIRSLGALRSDAPELADLLGRPVTRIDLAAYTPEGSATAACFVADDEQPAAYAKVYADALAATTSHAIHEAVSDQLGREEPELRLPRALGYSAASHLLLVEAIRGVRINEIQGSELEQAVGLLGAATARLHGLRPPAGVAEFNRLDPARLPGAAELLGAARPDVRDLAAELAAELGAAFTPPDDTPVCLHGDVHMKNGILQDGRVALIDLDQISTGPAAAELGSAKAAIRSLAIAGHATHAEAHRLESALMAGYARVRRLPDATQIRWYTAAALFNERAIRAINRLRPGGLAALETTLLEAQREIRGAAA